MAKNASEKIINMKIVYDPYTPKNLSYARKVKCAYPGCQCEAINSHLLQKNRWLKEIAEDGKVLQMSDEQMQSLMDGDEKGNVYSIMSINNALSLPIYCPDHDRKLFKEFEVKELDISNNVHLLKLSYRAFCANLSEETRRNIFYEINPIINPNLHGWVFDEQKLYSKYVIGEFEAYRSDLYAHMKSKDVSNFVFRVIKMPRVPISLSDVLISESDLYTAYLKGVKEPFFPIFVHALPYMDESVLILGYDKRYCNEHVLLNIETWVACEDKNKVILDLMVKANNWCVSPSFFGERTEEMCETILKMKMKYAFGVDEYAHEEITIDK